VADPEVELDSPENKPAQISLHALMGHTVPQTLQVMGQIQKQPVTVLIDSGSTHNFLQDRVAKQLDLTLEPTHSFQVLVGNGEELQYTMMCSQAPLFLGAREFRVNLFVLPLSGAELVLGVQWLKTLGLILTYYNNLTMSFTRNGTRIHLSGVPKPPPEVTSLHQLQRLVSTDSIDICLQLELISPDSKPDPPAHPQVSLILTKNETLFQKPTSLPPQRPGDHKIPLQHPGNLVNVRPYRYPRFQKQEIENQIKEMLENGIIQHSSSAFSSAVLLVCKKDGSWRFCVNYRALNAMTIKDRFPILAIDELLDELYGTR